MVSQVSGRRLLGAEARVQFQGSPCGIFDEQVGTRAGFSPSIFVFLCHLSLHQCSILNYHQGLVQWAHLRSQCPRNQFHATFRSKPKSRHPTEQAFNSLAFPEANNSRTGDGSLPFCSPRSLFWNKKFWEDLMAHIPWYDTCHIENDASNNSSIVACVFVTAVKFLPSRCLATIWGYTDTHTQSNVILLAYFIFQNKESRLMRSRCCLCVYPPINFWMPEPIFIKLGTYITATEPISTA
jgi:hypothetical protein